MVSRNPHAFEMAMISSSVTMLDEWWATVSFTCPKSNSCPPPMCIGKTSATPWRWQ